ncbi:MULTISPECIES: transketolase [unclassified Gilliamella]|uniref:transketolase n=1 Tax=unclassified Gilliamella TaxID=2685620 RepID=UPI00226A1D9F|nr:MULTISPECIES: transketolase [unclassified Gilliamella]MCX8584096.1 transketolase [Gilliamella sp. B3372]MCX8593951.1 transketolase [Gilliamella sp. B3367]
MLKKDLEQTIVNTVRTLSIDMIEKANSGHPGMPMGAAPMAYSLFSNHLKFNPNNPNWFNRDRFVLSAGHGSALLYSLLHLFGYDVTLDDLKSFRQHNSRTPGHPEFGWTPGVDATSGPLGQGIAMAVGMALAESHLAAQYNKPDNQIVDHYTYAICGDGDLMEGVSAEAASLAGHLSLGKLIVLYDSNNICLDGDLNITFSESVAKRFESYNWQVLTVSDGNNLSQINSALTEAKISSQPTLIEVKTTIGYGAPNKSNSSACHGSPLGEKEALATKQFYQCKNVEPFYIPKEVKQHLKKYSKLGDQNNIDWNKQYEKYCQSYPDEGKQLGRVIAGHLPSNWKKNFPEFNEVKPIATRSASGKMINAISDVLPEFFGGSADLGCSNKTFIDSSDAYSKKFPANKNIWFGVREFAMGSILNGMALHRGLRSFGATFFVFSDYLRPAIRMAALMNLPVTYVFTHDSVAVGEDGPTHEPIEHLASLRAMPNLTVIRPADAKETRAAWEIAIENQNGPIALVLSRQDLPILANSQQDVTKGVKKGAYIVSPAVEQTPDIILIATGSEVSLAIEAQSKLREKNIDASVVSLSSWEIFAKTAKSYQESILPSNVKARLAIEAGCSFGWSHFVGEDGYMIGIDHFGDSAPAKDLFKAYGFTVENIIHHAQRLVKK